MTYINSFIDLDQGLSLVPGIDLTWGNLWSSIQSAYEINQRTAGHHGTDACEEIVGTQANNYITGDTAFAVDKRG